LCVVKIILTRVVVNLDEGMLGSKTEPVKKEHVNHNRTCSLTQFS